MKIYEALGLRLTYNLSANAVDVEVEKLNGPGLQARSADYVRNTCARRGSRTISPPNPWAFCDDLHLAYSTL